MALFVCYLPYYVVVIFFFFFFKKKTPTLSSSSFPRLTSGGISPISILKSHQWCHSIPSVKHPPLILIQGMDFCPSLNIEVSVSRQQFSLNTSSPPFSLSLGVQCPSSAFLVQTTTALLTSLLSCVTSATPCTRLPCSVHCYCLALYPSAPQFFATL